MEKKPGFKLGSLEPTWSISFLRTQVILIKNHNGCICDLKTENLQKSFTGLVDASNNRVIYKEMKKNL